MAVDGSLRTLFRDHLPGVFWTSVETGGTGRGVPDSHGLVGGRAFWIEYKWTDGWAVTLAPEQTGWLQRYARQGGRAYIAVRRRTAAGPRSLAADELYLLWGGQAALARRVGLRGIQTSAPHALLGQWSGGPARWRWPEVLAILTR